MTANYAAPLRVEELAARVHMSPSSLHHHFRQLTAMSPLQYQKWLRLNEARRLMLNEGLDAAGASFKVGYESPSQFSREYARLFGAPPRRDVVSLRSKAAPSPISRSGLPSERLATPGRHASTFSATAVAPARKGRRPRSSELSGRPRWLRGRDGDLF